MRLDSLTPLRLRRSPSTYDPAELISAEVYPAIWEQDWALSYLEDYYTQLVALFRAAAADREPILVWMA